MEIETELSDWRDAYFMIQFFVCIQKFVIYTQLYTAMNIH